MNTITLTEDDIKQLDGFRFYGYEKLTSALIERYVNMNVITKYEDDSDSWYIFTTAGYNAYKEISVQKIIKAHEGGGTDMLIRRLAETIFESGD